MTEINLNRKLALEAATVVPDGAGGTTETWGVLGTLWAKVEPRAGRAVSGETGALSTMGFDVWVRGAPVGHSARPQPGQRFVMATRRIVIEAVTEEEPRAMFLKCFCTEEVSA